MSKRYRIAFQNTLSIICNCSTKSSAANRFYYSTYNNKNKTLNSLRNKTMKK